MDETDETDETDESREADESRGTDASDQICDVTVTAASPEWLAGWVRGLVEDRLVACGNIDVGAVRSIYRWEGEVEDEVEARVTLHTRRSLVPEIVARADRDHPDDTPQVLALPVVAAHPGYHRWVLDSTRPV